MPNYDNGGPVVVHGPISVLGKELNATAAFYPILMLIVGTSDVIHIMDDYLRKLKTGFKKKGSSCLDFTRSWPIDLTYFCNYGNRFSSLLTSKSSSISDFGINATMGVLTAFITAFFFTSALLLLPKKVHMLPKREVSRVWSKTLIVSI